VADRLALFFPGGKEPFDALRLLRALNFPSALKRGENWWWPDPESNWGHKDFQSSALPTELSGRKIPQWKKEEYGAVLGAVNAIMR
jgi:hypothetical protein